MIRVYFLGKPRLSFYAICGDIVRSSLFQAFRYWGRQKGTRRKNSAGWGRGESYLSSPSLQSIFFPRSLTFHCTPLSTSRERGPCSVATNILNYQTFLS